ncbi:hypothetical protein GALMADRAFT_1140363 [Galerina marginata CBS 339.88]|uniref:Uncharacterized protein n=1 Tax=Galerina marginata (strain CBS 339.88) TaxID=685588 RepID=A0A067S7H1_GALM3|nr:hypothetical protein GALMADRAFT_1140363 [Galerina marginata CBS 339.88]
MHSRGRGLLLEKPIRATAPGVDLRGGTCRCGYGVNETRCVRPAIRQREAAKSAGPGLEAFLGQCAVKKEGKVRVDDDMLCETVEAGQGGRRWSQAAA